MIVLMKKNDANTVRGLKEMVEAAFRDLQTGAKQPDLGKRLRGCSTHRREACGASEHTGSWGHGALGPVVTSPSRPHPSVRSGKRTSASTHREMFCPTGTADTPGRDSAKGATVKGKRGLENGPHGGAPGGPGQEAGLEPQEAAA